MPLAVPALILGGLVVTGGGFDVEARHAAGILAWILVAVLLVSPYRKGIRFAGPFVAVAGLMVAFAALSALSSAWSSSVAASLVEAERVVAYLGFFTLAFLVCQTDRQRRRFVEGVFLVIALIVVLAVADRLFPMTQESLAGEGPRLRFPLGYWNAVGLVGGIGVVFFAWMNRAGSHAVLRWLAAALIPVAWAVLYLTYSRGGIAAVIVSLLSLFFLSRERLRVLVVVLLGALAALPTVLFIQGNPAIAENLGGPDGPSEGRAVALVLAGSMLATILMVRAMIAFSARNPALRGRALAVSRDQRVLKGIAAAGAATLLILAVVFGGHVWSEYSKEDFSSPDEPQLRFTQLTGTGRYEFSRVALESFSANPLTGTGAGTYQFEWLQQRRTDQNARDAHSLYLESFTELGLVGGMLVLALVFVLLRIAYLAWRLSAREERDRSAMLFSILLAILVSASFDWTWELAATAGLLMFVSACLAATLQSRRSTQGVLRSPRCEPRAGQIALGLGFSWLAIVVLAVPFAADQYMQASEKAAADGRIEDSIRSARNASRLEPWSPTPHLQLGAVFQSRGLRERSIAEYSRAAELEPDNWQPLYLRAIAEFQDGKIAAALADAQAASLLNPRSSRFEDLQELIDETRNGAG